MKDGLFKTYFKIILAVLVFCIIFLGVAMLIISGVNYTTNRQETLKHAAEKGVGAAINSWNGSYFNFSDMSAMLKLDAGDEAADVYFADINGNIIACSETDCHHGDKAPVRGVRAIQKKGTYEDGAYIEGFIGENADYITGLPVVIGDEVRGYIFATVSMSSLFSYLYETMFTYLFSVGVMLMVAFVVIYTYTMQLTEPLRDMSKAAEEFGKGNFDSRVQVKGKDEIAILAESFNSMAESLSEFETNRRSFVANVSHDLRTPMTTIGGYIDAILDGTIPKEQERKYLTVVSEEVKRLSRLTSSLLQVMKMEENRQEDIELVSVDAVEILVSVMFGMEQRLSDKNITVPEPDIPSRMNVRANRDMLYQVVYNLIDNAVKYTPNSGEINIDIYSSEGKGFISVFNTGKGIAPEEQPFIFERFYKTDKSRGIDKSGTGLGLYIVKMLTSGMGGKVELDSDGESYTRFTVSFELDKNSVAMVQAVDTEESSKQNTVNGWRKVFGRMNVIGRDKKKHKNEGDTKK